MKFIKKDISEKKEFTFEGDTLKQKECLDPEKHIYLYERFNHLGYLFGYELVKGVKTKNPDGSVVYIYPCSEQFGNYGYFLRKNGIEKELPKYLLYLQDPKARRDGKREARNVRH